MDHSVKDVTVKPLKTEKADQELINKTPNIEFIEAKTSQKTRETNVFTPLKDVLVEEIGQQKVEQPKNEQNKVTKAEKVSKSQKIKKNNKISHKTEPVVLDTVKPQQNIQAIVQPETKVVENTRKVETVVKEIPTISKTVDSETKISRTKTITKTVSKQITTQTEIQPLEGELEVVDNTTQAILNVNKQLETITLKTTVSKKLDYSTIKMDYDDAKFFADLVQNPEETLQTVVTEIQNTAPEPTVQKASKNVNVSASLINLLSDAVKTNQPVRIDFDKDISIIIKVDKDGSLTAKFIPGDKAVEQYLKQNISALQQRFDDQEISYKELSYSNQQQRRNRRNNKEN